MRTWGPLVAVCLGTLMLMVDITIVIVALPSMAGDLHSSFSDLQWVIDAYALTLAALLLTAGSLADRLGRRRVYLAGLVLFAASSLGCAVAPDTAVLIASRAAQGLGGAAMLATTMALLSHSYSGRRRGVAFGVWAAVSGASAAAGPILGGLLTEYLDWRAIFLVNLPVCVLAVVLTRLGLGESRNPHPGSLDIAGMLTFTLAAGSLTYALSRGADDGWASGPILGLFAVAAAALLAFLVVETRRRYPMLDLSLFRNRSFSALLAAGMLLSAGAFGYLTYTSLWLQSVLGDGPVRAGLVGSLGLSGAGLVVSVTVGHFLHGISPKLPVGLGLVVLAAGDLLESRLTATSPGTHLVPGLVVAGVGMGLSLPVLSSAVMAAVPRDRAGMASGALNTFRQLGLALGIAVFGAVFRTGLGGALPASLHGSAAALAGGRTGAVLAAVPATDRAAAGTAVRHAFAVGLDNTLTVAAAVTFAAGLAVLLLVSRDRSAAPAPAAPEPARI
jgi:EmrB/QacA subfamily drug resistance transporter